MEVQERGEILTSEQLRAAEEGFAKLLRAKRMNPQFIAEHAEELMAQARREFATWCERGKVAQNPVGWLVNCAWQRTKDLLDSQRRRPHQLSIDEVLHVVDEQTPDPEQVAIDHDHSEKILRALSLLPEKERQLIYLSYFNGLDVKAAGHQVGWKKSAAHRHHEAALDRLRSILGRDFAILDVALLAWILEESEAAPPAPGLFAAVLEMGQEAVAFVTHRAAEIWRRLSPLGDPANASLASTGAKVSGACATAVTVACLAGGVIGSGITALKPEEQQEPKPSAAAVEPVSSEGTHARGPEAVPADPKQKAASKATHQRKAWAKVKEEAAADAAKPSPTASRPQSAASAPTPPSSVPQQTSAEFGIENSGGEPSPAPAPAPASNSPAVAESTEAPSSGAGHHSAEGAAVAREFGM
jgi:RNA polymerase sigma factor (sigma-70 family)